MTATEPTPEERRVWSWEDHVLAALTRVKQRRGNPLHRKSPVLASKWDNPACPWPGCLCTHGKRGEARGDLCDRGLVPDPGEPGSLRHCRTCLDAARRQAEKKASTA